MKASALHYWLNDVILCGGFLENQVEMADFKTILQEAIDSRPDLDEAMVSLAYEYMEKVCGGRIRKTGDTVMDHVLGVLKILIPLHPDDKTIIAALLHDAPKSPDYKPDEVRALFGDDVCSMVESVNLLRRIKSSDQKSELESFRKMFLAMAKDVRVVLIKMSDRLHNLMVADKTDVEERKLLARETMDIYAAVASRLGIYKLKVQLEDIAFKYLYPQYYENVKSQLDEYMEKMGKDIIDVRDELESLLKKNGIDARVEGRIKNLYSIYRKLKLKSHASINDLYDIFAMRVILANRYTKGQLVNDQLYAVLGLIHSKWTPLTNRFKDYVAVPKPNGYQSLHTAVVGLSRGGFHATEIQIRNESMHYQSEFGIASHWLYDDTKKIKNTDKVKQSVADTGNSKSYHVWVEELSNLQKELKSGSAVVKALKFDFFNDRIYVFTPGGDVRDLPKGATPIDFAYSIHSDLGQHCQVAKVNGSVVPMDHELHNGEIVEIITNSRSEPKAHWLSFVKTSLAKSRIRAYLKGPEQSSNFREGKETVNRLLEKEGKPLLDEDLSFLHTYRGRQLSYKERVTLVEDIGRKAIVASTVLKNLYRERRPLKKEVALAAKVNKKIVPTGGLVNTGKEEIFISGVRGLPFKLSACCKPKMGQSIVGYLTRGKAVSIHQDKCKLLKNAPEQRLVEAYWGCDFKKQRIQT